VSILRVSDADLVARARRGDTAAFGELVDRHRAAVYRAARAALASHADAEDAAQEAFIVAYRRLSSFRGDASFKTWLLTIAWHQAINRRRHVSRWWRRLADANDSESMEHIMSSAPSPSSSPEQQAADDELRRHVAAEIRSLTPKLRDALLLAQAGDYSYEEIGRMLGVPLGTIKWRVSEARRILKDRLKARGYAHVG
jgi:RNA polymerase sigma-70 factor, ECF subfamily